MNDDEKIAGITVLVALAIYAIVMSIMIPGFGIGICYALLYVVSLFAAGAVMSGIMYLLYSGALFVLSKIRCTH